MATVVKLTAALGGSQGWRYHMIYKPGNGPILLCKYRDNRDAQVASSSGATVETIILKLNCDTGPSTIQWADSQYIRQTQPSYLGNAYSGATWAAAYLYQLSFVPPEPLGYFEGEAKKYRNAETKPILPESVREFKVRAESAVAEKRFVDAVEAYDRALQIAPWWTEGHFNVALILSELKVYGLAIEEMERYLLLVPEAADARQAQDKIYTWKGRL
jgi:tetratricopeptide (TPR) repeat protein